MSVCLHPTFGCAAQFEIRMSLPPYSLVHWAVSAPGTLPKEDESAIFTEFMGIPWECLSPLSKMLRNPDIRSSAIMKSRLIVPTVSEFSVMDISREERSHALMRKDLATDVKGTQPGYGMRPHIFSRVLRRTLGSRRCRVEARRRIDSLWCACLVIFQCSGCPLRRSRDPCSQRPDSQRESKESKPSRQSIFRDLEL